MYERIEIRGGGAILTISHFSYGHFPVIPLFLAAPLSMSNLTTAATSINNMFPP